MIKREREIQRPKVKKKYGAERSPKINTQSIHCQMKKYTLEQTNEELNRKNEDINIGTSYEKEERKRNRQVDNEGTHKESRKRNGL